MNTVHLEINLDAETKRRVEAAAAEKKVSVNEYLLESIRSRLEIDGKLASGEADFAQRQIYEVELLQKIAELHASILARREGEPLDLNTIIDLVRDERDADILGLR